MSILPQSSDEEIIQSSIPAIDSDWVYDRFIVGDKNLPDEYVPLQYATRADDKWMDTTLGGDLAVNPRPQHCRYADPRVSTPYLPRDKTTVNPSTNLGMGEYYSKSIHDNTQQVYLEFGVAEHNSMVDFFTRAIDYNDVVIANTGYKSTAHTAGKVIGGAVMLIAFPIVTLTVWAAKAVISLTMGDKSFKYYYLKPTPHLYWSTVNTILTQLATELGLLRPEFLKDQSEDELTGTVIQFNDEDMEELKEVFPGLITDGNYIDVFAIATRAQSVANVKARREYKLLEELEKKTEKEIREGYVKKNSLLETINNSMYFSNYLTHIQEAIGDLVGDLAPKDEVVDTEVVNAKVEQVEKFTSDSNGRYDKLKDTASQNAITKSLDATLRQGAMFAIFNVDYTGSATESFSNSVGNINLGDSVKQLSMRARDIKFDTAGGNLVEGMGEVTSAVKGFVTGALDSVSMGLSNVLSGMASNGVIAMDQKWDDSSMSLPSVTYSMDLMAVSGNPIAKLQNIWLPVSMILAGMLPQSAGKSAYTSPLLCSLFSKGVQRIEKGMIVSASIERGTSNLGFDRNRNPLAVRISFTVADFNTIITSPVNSSMFDVFNVNMEDDTPLGNYLAVMGGRNILTNKYASRRTLIKASRAMMNVEQRFSGAGFGMMLGGVLDPILGALVSDGSITATEKS